MHASTIFGSEYILRKILLGDWQKEYKLRSDMCLSGRWPKSGKYFSWEGRIRVLFGCHMEVHDRNPKMNKFFDQSEIQKYVWIPHGISRWKSISWKSFVHSRIASSRNSFAQQVPHVHSLMVRITAVSYLYTSFSWNYSKVSYIAWRQKFHSI